MRIGASALHAARSTEGETLEQQNILAKGQVWGLLGAARVRLVLPESPVDPASKYAVKLRIVQDKKIDLVYTHWTGDIHHDHQAVARASLHSCRHVPRLLMYRSNWYHSTQDFRGNFYVDITDFWNTKEQAIRAHVSEVDRTGNKWISFFRNEAENAGQKIGVAMAEVFEVVKYLDSK